jgi:hypothetical protein
MKTLAIAAVFLIACTAAAQRVPDMKPGDTCEKLRATYGNEASQDGPAHVWQQDGLTIRVLVKPGGPCVAGLVEYSIQPGHTFRTHDGIILGKDTIAEARLKLKGRIDANSYVSLRGEGKAYGQLEVAAIAGYPFKGTYSWQLNPAVADKLSTPPKLTDFTNEPVIVYSIDSADSK